MSRRASLLAARWSAFTIAVVAGVTLAYLERSLVTVLLAIVWAGGFLLFSWTFRSGGAQDDHAPSLLPDVQAKHDEMSRRWRAVSPFFDQDDPAVSRLDRLDGLTSRRPAN